MKWGYFLLVGLLLIVVGESTLFKDTASLSKERNFKYIGRFMSWKGGNESRLKFFVRARLRRRILNL